MKIATICSLTKHQLFHEQYFCGIVCYDASQDEL